MAGPEPLTWKTLALELTVYAVLVGLYVLLVLRFLDQWLFTLFSSRRTAYAVVALALIVAQGVVLDEVTSGLVRLFRTRTDE